MNEIRINIIRIVIHIGKIFLNIIYFFIKIFPSRNKVVMLSRQSDNSNIDFDYIKKEIFKRNSNVEIKVLCKVLRKDPKERLKYCLYLFKCMYHIATSKVCILDGYSIPISILKHKKSLTIIQIWHASGAIKKFGYQSLNKKEGRGIEVAKLMNMHKNYDYIIAPSKVTAKFYEKAFGVDSSKIVINGLPRLDYIFGDEISNKKIEEFFKAHPKYKNKKTILYVPTFRKELSNSKYIRNLIKSIDLSKYNLIIKLHPLDKNKKISKYTVDKKYNTYDLLKIADYIITDYSAVAFEASILDKPLYFYVYDIDKYQKERGLNIDLFKEMSSSTSKDIKIIIKNIENNDYNFEELEKFKTKYMGEDYYNNTKKIVDFIFKYLDKDVDDGGIEKEIKENTYEHSEEKLNV